jgi:hypothetical protein
MRKMENCPTQCNHPKQCQTNARQDIPAKTCQAQANQPKPMPPHHTQVKLGPIRNKITKKET